jgi:hypothetical protein
MSLDFDIEKQRAEISKNWPEAVWYPWDEPPIGRRVLLSGASCDYPATIVRQFEPWGATEQPVLKCPTCGHVKQAEYESAAPYHGWWVVAFDGWAMQADDTGCKRPMTEGDRPFEVLAFPPQLRPLDSGPAAP